MSLQFQAGAFDPWGGHGFDMCAALVNHEYERVFYKNNFSFGIAIFNVYMVCIVPNLFNTAFRPPFVFLFSPSTHSHHALPNPPNRKHCAC